ncbi:MAG: hypothetical protein JRG80_13855 [Deltaproteobacteria bacterium]|nr:hypothetical protein [Deltaproteobacteria bacterium]
MVDRFNPAFERAETRGNRLRAQLAQCGDRVAVGGEAGIDISGGNLEARQLSLPAVQRIERIDELGAEDRAAREFERFVASLAALVEFAEVAERERPLAVVAGLAREFVAPFERVRRGTQCRMARGRPAGREQSLAASDVDQQLGLGGVGLELLQCGQRLFEVGRHPLEDAGFDRCARGIGGCERGQARVAVGLRKSATRRVGGQRLREFTACGELAAALELERGVVGRECGRRGRAGCFAALDSRAGVERHARQCRAQHCSATDPPERSSAPFLRHSLDLHSR